jgi:hypothetical protein
VDFGLVRLRIFAQALKGDDKSEGQSFLDFFRALGHKGVIEAGARFELRHQAIPARGSVLIRG